MPNNICCNCKCGIMCSCKAKNNKNKKESVNHPDHYLKDTGHEVIKVIQAWKLCYELGNVVKYVARAGRKDPAKTIEDLQKAKKYIDLKIEDLKS
jgi:hypothetical protein